MKELIPGAARSGKSDYTEICATESGLDILYLATAQTHHNEIQPLIADTKTKWI